MPLKLAAIFLGGGLGAVARYGLGSAVQRLAGGAWPIGTLAVNLLGCFAIGALGAHLDRRPEWLPFLVVGLLGGFTTFSAFGLETWTLWQQAPWRGAAHAVLHVVLGIAAVAVGAAVAR